MAKYRYLIFLVVFSASLLLFLKGIAQPYSSIELVKPKPYQDRPLVAETTGPGKIKAPKRFYQNAVTHYNYYFNAYNKINEILERAKGSFQDDFTELLPFYNYTMEGVSKNAVQLDSVIYKCTAGILLHDLRTDWVDDLYLLMGQAYLYKQYYDSAATVFQYINYSFAPKDDGYDLPIGSNASNQNGTFSISTVESKSLWKKLTSNPPGRNESFLWRVRTYLEQNKLAEAGALIEIIRIDPNFPVRLYPHLHELIAYKYYKENTPDSAAVHLIKALDRAINKGERARWQYLIGQLYTSIGKDSLAVHYFKQAIKTTVDPTLEVYAHLAISSLESVHKQDAVQQNLEELKKMGKRPLYEEYKDIIFYAAAKLELKQKHPDQAQDYLLKSIKFNQNNLSQRQESFLLLADLNYNRKRYQDAYRFYDSLDINQLKDEAQLRVNTRKPALKIINDNLIVINTEDSLQKIALMPLPERTTFLNNKLKQLRKEAGLKESENTETTFGNINAQNILAQNNSQFGSSGTDFYFQNFSLKTRGLTEFKAKWGNRPNVDNWRRQSAVEKSFARSNPNSNSKTITQNSGDAAIPKAKELSIEALTDDLPLTNEKMSASYFKVLTALLGNGNAFQNELYDYPSAIDDYRTIVTRFTNINETEKSYFNLIICYDRNNQPIQADSIRNLLKLNFPNGNYTRLSQQKVKEIKSDPATDTYKEIYDLFLAGDFKKAIETKQKADKIFGTSYWTPQQLYIEAIYYIKNREDSIANKRLEVILARFPKSPMSDKAAVMVDVLHRRKEIESYLTNLNIEKPEEEAIRQIDLDTIATVKTAVPFQSGATIKQTPKELKLPGIAAPAVKPVTIAKDGYSFNPTDSQYVAVILTKVDGIYASEGKNAFNRYNRDNYNNQKIGINASAITSQELLILIGPFANAGDAVGYLNKTKPLAASRIVPWLAADKYSFTIISGSNLNILLTNKDMAAYKSFMHSIFPDIF
jgi:outer membrane protein assembly factor BamD (BamD/ComL family)/Tfp pilus assembly protein PilF